MAEILLSFAVAALLLAMVPGPATVIVIRATLRGGRRTALVSTSGNALGIVLWAVAAGAGLSALVAASQLAFDVLRIVGAAVLIYLGVRSLRAAEPDPKADGSADAPVSGRARSAFRVGLVTNLANPKAAVFAITLYPQFIPQGAPVLAWVLLLAGIQVVLSSAWYTTLAWSIDRTQRLLSRPGIARRLEQASGVVLISLGASLAVRHR